VSYRLIEKKLATMGGLPILVNIKFFKIRLQFFLSGQKDVATEVSGKKRKLTFKPNLSTVVMLL